MKFTVLRPHFGDKHYAEGDIREIDERDVAHLIKSGVLAKAAPEVANKAEPKVANKSASKGKAR